MTLSVNPTSVGEADGATAVVVTAALDGAARGSATAVTVAVGDGGDSATEGTDYATVSDFTVTIGANATSGTGTFTLTPTQDLLVEGDETISVKGTATGLTVTGASLTLTDDETASTEVTLSVNPTSVGEADGATAVVVTAALDGGRGDGGGGDGGLDGGDRATEGTDYGRGGRRGTVRRRGRTTPRCELHGDDRGERDERDRDVHLDADAGLTGRG